jgi:hypothetical protein
MTNRHIQIAKCILNALHALDGGQAHELIIHADASLLFRAIIPKNEFDDVFTQLNADGCFIGVKTKFKGTLWSLSDQGRQAREEIL